MTNNHSSESAQALAGAFSATINNLTSEAQLAMDVEFTSLWDEISQDLTESQVETICLLETQRQQKALDALVKTYFSSDN